MGYSDIFDLEAKMSAPVEKWLSNQGLLVKKELSVPWGICDLVALKFDEQRIKKRISYGQTSVISRQLRFQLLALIPDQECNASISLKSLSTKFPLFPLENLTREMQWLVRNKFVNCPRANHFQKINGWAPLHSRIVAVELKVSRVAEVYAQARANLTFATDSYVALPADVAERMLFRSRVDEIEESGIGLLSIEPSRCEELIRPSKSHASDTVIQDYVTERFWTIRDS